MSNLVKARSYKEETFFHAVALFDRYIFHRPQALKIELTTFAVMCVLLAAKLDNKTEPSLHKLIDALKTFHKVRPDAHSIALAVEFEILSTL